MDHLKALLIKLVMVTAVLWIVLGGFFGVSLGDIFATGVILTGVSYLGDVFLLPSLGNVGATISDFGLSFAGVWVLGIFLFEGDFSLGSAALISAVIITVGEYFFHIYMAKQDLTDESGMTSGMGVSQNESLQTEFGSELDPESDIQKDQDNKNNKE